MRVSWPLVLLLSLALAACDAPVEEDGGSEDGGGGGGGGGSPSSIQTYAKFAKDTNADTKIVVKGVTSGQTVTLYSGNSCGSEIASATASGTSHSFDVSGLAIGTHSFSAKADGGDCSTVNGSYTRVGACPTGYVKVEGDSALGVKPFCVMQFEAKNVSGVPTSQAASQPWWGISPDDMKAKCRAVGADYDLISSLEWQAMARDIEQQNVNWITVPGSTTIAQGLYNGEGGESAVSDPSNPWSDATHLSNPTTAFSLRRTLHMSNGSIVWDLSGNAAEFVDYGMASTYTSPPECVGGSDRNSAYIVAGHNNCVNTPSQHFMTVNPTGDYTDGYGSVATTNSAGSIIRGGGNPGGSASVHTGFSAWVMHGQLPSDPGNTHLGFRCVKRLNSVPFQARTVAMTLYSQTTLNLTGTQAGDTYTFGTDGRCTNNVGSVTATGNTATVKVTMPSAGVQDLYFKVTSPDGIVGTCLPHKVAYEWRACPTGFVVVPGNSARGVADFCVMKYEARKVGSTITVDPADDYSNSEYADGIRTQCQSLNPGSDTNIDAMTNAEWMTLADNVYNVASNWSTGIIGIGHLATGVTDQAGAAAVTTPSDPFSGVLVNGNPTTQFKYRRTLRLSTGEDVWDLAGNLEERLQFGVPANQHAAPEVGPACLSYPHGGAAYRELSEAAGMCPELASSALLPPNPALGSSAGMGQFAGDTSGGIISRGGSFIRGSAAGLYSYRLRSGNGAHEGFRCVYRP